MLDQLEQIAQRRSVLRAKLSAPETYGDPAQVAALNQELAELDPVADAYGEYRKAGDLLAEAQRLLDESGDAELRELAKAEQQEARERMDALTGQLRRLLLPRDPDDRKDVVLEIRAGVGGEEAALFARSLWRMYDMYCGRMGWRAEIASVGETELGGVKELVCTISGSSVYARLKYESGVHRVQRVPETESGGRIHTSTATVAVLPQVGEVDFALERSDLRIDTFRSSGAGGQHINKTSSAIRVTHLPTGMVVECQDQRSQLQNKERALQILRSRLYQQKVRDQQEALSAQRHSQVGSGMRNERIRTYNFPQGRVTDHRIGLTLHRIDDVLNGDLDELINALAAAEEAERLQNLSEGQNE